MPAFQPSLAQLFLAFLQIGVSSFGGALPWGRYVLVEKRGWLDETQFAQMLTICQTIPGPNIVNVAVYYGFKMRGLAGAAAAFFGLLTLPLFLVLALNVLYQRYAQVPQIKSALMGMTAMATGFMFSMAIKLATPFSRNGLAVAIALGTFALGAFLHWPMPMVLMTCGAISVFLAFQNGL